MGFKQYYLTDGLSNPVYLIAREAKKIFLYFRLIIFDINMRFIKYILLTSFNSIVLINLDRHNESIRVPISAIWQQNPKNLRT